MTEAQKLIVKYFHIVCRLDLQDTPIDFEGIKQWAENSPFFKIQFQTAIKCAINDTKNSIELLNLANLGSATTLLIRKETDILKELEAML